MIHYRSSNLSFHVCNVLNRNRVWFEALKMISLACQSISECPKLPCQSIDVSMLKFHNSSPPLLSLSRSLLSQKVYRHTVWFSPVIQHQLGATIFSSRLRPRHLHSYLFNSSSSSMKKRQQRAKPEGRPMRQTSTGSFPNDVQDSEWIWRLFISCFCTSVHCFRFSSCRFNTLYSLLVVTKSWNSVTGKKTRPFSTAMSCWKKVTNIHSSCILIGGCRDNRIRAPSRELKNKDSRFFVWWKRFSTTNKSIVPRRKKFPFSTNDRIQSPLAQTVFSVNICLAFIVIALHSLLRIREMFARDEVGKIVRLQGLLPSPPNCIESSPIHCRIRKHLMLFKFKWRLTT